MPTPLSERELQVLQLIATAASNKGIARELGLSVHTIKRHVARLMAKLGTNSRAEAAAIYRTMLPGGTPTQVEPLDDFTARELDVIARVVRGRSNCAIADELSVSINTVKRHAANIFDKLAVTSRIEVAALLDGRFGSRDAALALDLPHANYAPRG